MVRAADCFSQATMWVVSDMGSIEHMQPPVDSAECNIVMVK